MITNWGEKIARKLAASGTISPEEIDLYGYGFFLLLSSTLYLIVVAIFGMLTNWVLLLLSLPTAP